MCKEDSEKKQNCLECGAALCEACMDKIVRERMSNFPLHESLENGIDRYSVKIVCECGNERRIQFCVRKK